MATPAEAASEKKLFYVLIGLSVGDTGQGFIFL